MSYDDGLGAYKEADGVKRNSVEERAEEELNTAVLQAIHFLMRTSSLKFAPVGLPGQGCTTQFLLGIAQNNVLSYTHEGRGFYMYVNVHLIF